MMKLFLKGKNYSNIHIELVKIQEVTEKKIEKQDFVCLHCCFRLTAFRANISV